MNSPEEYNLRFCSLAERFERCLASLIICLFTLLVLGQIACTYEPVKHFFIETLLWEGHPFQP
ncbi:hypothetical protein ACI7RC_11665 [Brevibacillus sp. B_LB10_24]|uniref:hypothetical protein n=1 Tax=Brevibacillus sp. B_LB10_24 TaxID=3380645 RepID=UPI0038B83E1E